LQWAIHYICQMLRIGRLYSRLYKSIAKSSQGIIAENQSQNSSTLVFVITIDCPHKSSGSMANNNVDTLTSLEIIELSCRDNEEDDTFFEVEKQPNEHEHHYK
ncbi:Hypothetical protein FKW44_003819, partial [Caligus rogercresseyi]